jgi:hypothetical protein
VSRFEEDLTMRVSRRAVTSVVLVLSFATVAAAQRRPPRAAVVDCAAGESIGAALTRLSPDRAGRLLVRGHCSESVSVRGFDDLRIVGLGDATLTTTASGPESAVISVFASRSVAIENLTIEAAGADCGILLHRCQDCSVKRVTVNNGDVGIHVSRMSWASLSHVTILGARTIGITAVDTAIAELDHAEIDSTRAGAGWTGWMGLWAGKHGQLMIESTRVRNYFTGVGAAAGGVIDFQRYPPAGGDRTVRIEGNSFGISASASSTIGLGSVPVVISGSTIDAIVAENSSSVSIGAAGPVSVDSNAHDVSCDSLSAVVGSGSIVGLDPAKVSCPNLR